MDTIKQIVNKEYNKFKEEMNTKTWEKLNAKISDIDTEISDGISNFNQDSE